MLVGHDCDLSVCRLFFFHLKGIDFVAQQLRVCWMIWMPICWANLAWTQQHWKSSKAVCSWADLAHSNCQACFHVSTGFDSILCILRKRMKLTESEETKDLPSTTAGGDAKEGGAPSSSAGVGVPPAVPEAEGPLPAAPILKPETAESSSVLRSASQICHSSSFEDKSAENTVCKASPGFPSQALFIDQKWCDKIFNNGKCWELRSCAPFVLVKHDFCTEGFALTASSKNLEFSKHSMFPLFYTQATQGSPFTHVCMILSPRTQKRGRICIAQSKSNLLVGEVNIHDSLKAGMRSERYDGSWVPVGHDPVSIENFFMAPHNMHKHQLDDFSILRSYSTVHAWVFTQVKKYDPAIAWTPKRGCVVFANLDGTFPRPDQEVTHAP